jgi:hypothetical protein
MLFTSVATVSATDYYERIGVSVPQNETILWIHPSLHLVTMIPKILEDFMKKILILCLGFTIGLIAYQSYKIWTMPVKAEETIRAFFAHLSKQEYEQAFQYVHYFDSFANVPATISKNEAEEIWVKRVEALQKQGIFVKELQEVSIHRQDWCCVGAIVSFVVVDDGTETIFDRAINMEDKIISFVPGEPELTELDEALSGDMRKETGFTEK